MEKLLKAAALIGVGFVCGVCAISKNVNDGEVVYEDDEMYVRAEEDKTGSCSYAKVHWKKPQ